MSVETQRLLRHRWERNDRAEQWECRRPKLPPCLSEREQALCCRGGDGGLYGCGAVVKDEHVARLWPEHLLFTSTSLELDTVELLLQQLRSAP